MADRFFGNLFQSSFPLLPFSIIVFYLRKFFSFLQVSRSLYSLGFLLALYSSRSFPFSLFLFVSLSLPSPLTFCLYLLPPSFSAFIPSSQPQASSLLLPPPASRPSIPFPSSSSSHLQAVINPGWIIVDVSAARPQVMDGSSWRRSSAFGLRNERIHKGSLVSFKICFSRQKLRGIATLSSLLTQDGWYIYHKVYTKQAIFARKVCQWKIIH